MIRVVIADDEALVRAGLRTIVSSEPDLEVVGEAEDGERALAAVAQHFPDVLLLDVRMPGMDGLAVARELQRRPSAPRVLILTTFDSDDHLYAALEAGACGFLLKTVSPTHLAHAIRVVAAGDSLLDPALTRRLLATYVRRSPASARRQRPFSRLTERETEVLALMAEGLGNEEICHRLHIGMSTTRTHVRSVLAKLGVHDRVGAVVLAFRSGLVS